MTAKDYADVLVEVAKESAAKAIHEQNIEHPEDLAVQIECALEGAAMALSVLWRRERTLQQQ